ncbi:hypothetical protein CVT24_008117 [Panaeolus cyanescens]|uniref:F-box domain-containing protein n=1 Tax=Panaeolus cyanescens TaxID=181874 RepID=A0A409YMV5_9AGAR|nr:hypothetical protein CVT24_008117 [Panaeolus cyanescens]
MLDLTPTPRSLTSALPPEVLGHITNILADSLEISNVKDLKSLALVCKAFLPFCTAIIFSQIDASGRFGHEWHSIQGHVQRLQRLAQVFKANPKLLKHVRKLKIYLDEEQESYGLYVCFQDTILGFPNLTHLSSETMAKPGNGSAVLAWQKRMIEHYLAQNTLCGLSIESVVDIDFAKILNCTSLRQVDLITLPISCPIATSPSRSTSIFGNNICKIQIYSNPRFPLSILSLLPHLKDLNLNNTGVIPSGLCEEHRPSLMLETLCLRLENIDDLRAFCNFYKQHAKKAGLRPFEHLKKLEIRIREPEDAIISQTLLQDAKDLISLDIHCLCYIAAQPNLLLEHHFRTTFSRLTIFDLQISLDQDVSYDQTMSLVCGVFKHIPHMNVLERVGIFVKDNGWRYQEDEMDPTNLPTNPWGELACMLASPQRFPRLQYVKFSLMMGFGPAYRVIITSWKPEEAPQTPFSFLPASMVTLGRRLGCYFDLFILLT